MKLKSYQPKYQTRLIEIFQSNCPKYFDPNDESEFLDFLEKYTDQNYLVILNKNKVIGCGGHYTKEDRHGIAWVMFERNSIGYINLLKFVDKFFAEIESRIVRENKGFDIYINTTQVMEKLFNRYGFITYQVIKDEFGKGLDEYKMKKLYTAICVNNKL